jgi:lipooligosaccharide transport system permease protein
MTAPQRIAAVDGAPVAPHRPRHGQPLRRPSAVLERHVRSARRGWPVFLTGFAEPFLYLFSIGIGVGALVGDLTVGDQVVDYRTFVAPALFVAAAMNGAVFDATIGFFIRFKYAKTYDAMLATPISTGDVVVGEIAWAVARSGTYAVAFLATMAALGLLASPWSVLALGAALLVAFACAGAGLAGATFMRSFVDFDYLALAIVPMFLFSATFFPLDRYPGALAWVVQATPLYQGVALSRAATLGTWSWAIPFHVAYLLAMGSVGAVVANRRIARLLQP